MTQFTPIQQFDGDCSSAKQTSAQCLQTFATFFKTPHPRCLKVRNQLLAILPSTHPMPRADIAHRSSGRHSLVCGRRRTAGRIRIQIRSCLSRGRLPVMTIEILLRLQDLTSDNVQFGYRNVVPAVAHALLDSGGDDAERLRRGDLSWCLLGCHGVISIANRRRICEVAW